MMGNTSQCTEHVDHEDDSGTDLSASPEIMVMMTLTERDKVRHPGIGDESRARAL